MIHVNDCALSMIRAGFALDSKPPQPHSSLHGARQAMILLQVILRFMALTVCSRLTRGSFNRPRLRLYTNFVFVDWSGRHGQRPLGGAGRPSCSRAQVVGLP